MIDDHFLVPGHIHHVQIHHQGDFHLHELEGQIEATLDVGGIHDINDHIGPVVENKIPGHPFLRGVGGQAVGPRKVHHLHAHVALPVPAGHFIHGDPGIIGHVLTGPGEGVEDRGFSTIGLAGQGHQAFILPHGEIPRQNVPPDGAD